MLTFTSSSPLLSPPKPFHHSPFSFSPGVTLLPLHSKTRRRQPSSSMVHSLPPQVETFWEWLSDQKVVTQKSPVRPGLGPEGLGLVALRDIGKNEVVLEVPKRLWINPDMVSGSEIGSACSGLGWEEHLCLTKLAMYEQLQLLLRQLMCLRHQIRNLREMLHQLLIGRRRLLSVQDSKGRTNVDKDGMAIPL